MTGEAAHSSLGNARAFVESMLAVTSTVRGVTLRDIASGWAERRERRATSITPGHLNRLDNPLVALRSAPGGGKSSMLDVLGVLSAHALWDADLCPDERMRSILNSSVPAPIAYNGGSDPAVLTYDSDVEMGLALRILHSFFVGARADRLNIAEFSPQLLAPGETLVVETAVRACLLAAKKQRGSECGILLAVDEIVKLMRVKPDANLLSLRGRLLDTFSPAQLNIVVTSLDALEIVKDHAVSNRMIRWARLPALGQEAAESMMRGALHREAMKARAAAAAADRAAVATEPCQCCSCASAAAAGCAHRHQRRCRSSSHSAVCAGGCVEAGQGAHVVE